MKHILTGNSFRRILSTLTVAVIALNTTGCATAPPPPSPETRRELGTVGVMALSSKPTVAFHTYAKGWVAGAAKGGAQGAVQGLLEVLTESIRNPPTGPYAGVTLLITTVVMTTVGTIVYGVAGGLEAIPGKTAEQIERDLNGALGSARLADDLAAEIQTIAAGRQEMNPYTVTHLGAWPPGSSASRTDLTGRGIDTVVEVRVTEAGFLGGSGSDPEVSFYLNARVRLVAPDTGQEIYTRDFQYLSRQLQFADWFAEGSKELAAAFEEAVEVLSERILDELFLVTDFPFDSGLWALPGVDAFGSCWFRPLYPEVRYTSLWYSIRHNAPGIHIRYTAVDSHRPLLKWEPFPRPRDHKETNMYVLGRISEVTYDLKIWEVVGDYPGSLVYEINDLLLPEFRPPFPLKPCTKYFWTFRARYNMAGQPQLTRWAFSSIPSNVPGEYPQRPAGGTCNLDAIPATNYFRFVTP